MSSLKPKRRKNANFIVVVIVIIGLVVEGKMSQKMPGLRCIPSNECWLAPELPRVAEVTTGGHCHDLVDIKEGT